MGHHTEAASSPPPTSRPGLPWLACCLRPSPAKLPLTCPCPTAHPTQAEDPLRLWSGGVPEPFLVCPGSVPASRLSCLGSAATVPANLTVGCRGVWGTLSSLTLRPAVHHRCQTFRLQEVYRFLKRTNTSEHAGFRGPPLEHLLSLEPCRGGGPSRAPTPPTSPPSPPLPPPLNAGSRVPLQRGWAPCYRVIVEGHSRFQQPVEAPWHVTGSCPASCPRLRAAPHVTLL